MLVSTFSMSKETVKQMNKCRPNLVFGLIFWWWSLHCYPSRPIITITGSIPLLVDY